MKKMFLSTLFIIPNLLFSYELEFSKSFNKDIQNDKINSNIRVQIDSKEIEFINEKMQFFQDFIKDDSLVRKKNGNYSLLPSYNYKNNKQSLLGYRGTLSYTVETSEYEKLNQFVTQLNMIRNNMNTNKVKLSVSNVKWIVSDELYKNNVDLMRIESVDWIKEYVKTLQDKCIIKNISINKSRSNNIQRYSQNRMLEKTKVMNVVPSQTEQDIELNVNYKLECK